MQHLTPRWRTLLSRIALLSGILAMYSASIAEGGAQEKKAVRIALVSDTHTTRDTAEDQSLYKGHLDQVIDQVNQAKVDVVLIAGDLTQGGKTQDRKDFKSQIKSFTAPVLVVPGNHDIGNKAMADKPVTITTKRIESFEQARHEQFPKPSVVQEPCRAA